MRFLEATVDDSTSVDQGRPRRYHSLDALRGLACLLVVIYHTTMDAALAAEPGADRLSQFGYFLLRLTSRCWIGVPLFFVISGYCITSTLDSQLRNNSSVFDYFKRRFRRIYPAYWSALALSVLVIWSCDRFVGPGLFSDGDFVMRGPADLTVWQWLGNVSLVESWRHHLGGGGTRYLLPHAWTLCYEEQFYLVTGAVLLLARKRFFGAMFAITLVSIAAKVIARQRGVSLDGTFLDGRWLLFAAGVAVYYHAHHAGTVGRRMIELLLVVAALFSASVPRLLAEFRPNFALESFAAFGFALLIAALYRWDGRLSRAWALRPLTFCGRMCFSLYLIHPLVTKGVGFALFHAGVRGAWATLLLTVPICLLLSIGVGQVFYSHVERRFLNSRRDPQAQRHGPTSALQETPSVIGAACAVTSGSDAPPLLRLNESRY